MRQFLSKASAGGLSAGVVLLWCPLLFPADTLTSWLVRGVAWTVLFELLLHALAPFEQGVWEAAESRFADESKRSALRRAAPVASVALVAPVVLLAVGLDRQAPRAAEKQPVKVVRVTKVMRPVTVKRVVEREPVATAAAPVVAAAPAPVAPARSSQRARVRRAQRQASRSQQVERPSAKAEAAPRIEIGEAAPESTTVCSGTCAQPTPTATGSSLQ